MVQGPDEDKCHLCSWNTWLVPLCELTKTGFVQFVVVYDNGASALTKGLFPNAN
jgi:hypothetical protein